MGLLGDLSVDFPASSALGKGKRETLQLNNSKGGKDSCCCIRGLVAASLLFSEPGAETDTEEVNPCLRKIQGNCDLTHCLDSSTHTPHTHTHMLSRALCMQPVIFK